MKKLTTLIAALFFSFIVQGQSVLHYEFDNSLSEINGSGPVLNVLGDEGIYQQDTLGEVGDARKWVYRFENNSGFQFDNAAADNFLGESYTIELYFVFDELTSWKRVVDWKNRKSDNGAYVYNGQLNFYPYVYSDEAPVVEGEYTYYVITRNGDDQTVKIYTDAREEIRFTDTNGDALPDGDNVVNFFHDDLAVPNEASSGAVAMLKLYNYALDSSQIKTNYDDLAGNLFFIGEHGKINTPVRIYPNPVADKLNLGLGNFEDNEVVTIRMVNALGLTVLKTETRGGQTVTVSLSSLALQNGIYLLFAESPTKRSSGKILIRR